MPLYPAPKLTESPESVNFEGSQDYDCGACCILRRVPTMTARKTAAANTSDTLVPPDKLGFEEAMAELDNLIQAVENNRLPLEQTLQTYQRGQQLITRCGELLKNAEQRIQQFDGEQLSPMSSTERT